MIRMLIDTDTASDDAVALVLALRNPAVRVEAITVVAGNVPLAQGVQNALYTAELCGAAVPVYAGRAAPLLRPLETAEQIHGGDGMGDIGLPVRGRTPAPGHAADVIIERIGREPGELTLVTLGPLTNVALALLRAPELARQVARCVVMGGASDGYGNITPASEYNFWVDPEAARIVFGSGMPITMVGWDISRRYAVFNQAEAMRVRAIGTPLAHFCIDIQRAVQAWVKGHTHLPGFDLPDPIAMAVAIDPAVATRTTMAPVHVETSDGPCRGQTVLDHLGMLGLPHAQEVVLEADRARFVKMLEEAVG